MTWGFPDGTNGKKKKQKKKPTCQCRRQKVASLIPGSKRFPGKGHSNPLQHSCLENPMVIRAWPATVHGVTKSLTQLKWFSMHALVQIWQNENLLWMDIGDDYITMWKYWMPLNSTLKIIKKVNFMLCTFYHSKRKRKNAIFFVRELVNFIH